MGSDEDATHATLVEYLDFLAHSVEQHNGKIMHYVGDAVLAKFVAVVDALTAATSIQVELRKRNIDLALTRRMQFRIGINLADVIDDRGEIYGDGVNIAARLESLADPGGVCVSDAVFAAASRELPLTYEYMGEQQVKNIVQPLRAYRVILDHPQIVSGDIGSDGSESTRSRRPSIAQYEQ